MKVLVVDATTEAVLDPFLRPDSLASSLRTCSNSHNCPMKLRLGDIMERLVLTNLYASAMAIG